MGQSQSKITIYYIGSGNPYLRGSFLNNWKALAPMKHISKSLKMWEGDIKQFSLDDSFATRPYQFRFYFGEDNEAFSEYYEQSIEEKHVNNIIQVGQRGIESGWTKLLIKYLILTSPSQFTRNLQNTSFWKLSTKVLREYAYGPQFAKFSTFKQQHCQNPEQIIEMIAFLSKIHLNSDVDALNQLIKTESGRDFVLMYLCDREFGNKSIKQIINQQNSVWYLNNPIVWTKESIQKVEFKAVLNALMNILIGEDAKVDENGNYILKDNIQFARNLIVSVNGTSESKLSAVQIVDLVPDEYNSEMFLEVIQEGIRVMMESIKDEVPECLLHMALIGSGEGFLKVQEAEDVVKCEGMMRVAANTEEDEVQNIAKMVEQKKIELKQNIDVEENKVLLEQEV